ncbi:MAG TPA: MBL fold metallo-hydrolase [Symbiobacteriaceae bacterium]|nr:MBL fold metallo-hydrolase [Symbiobacteriaceae bacterium]
MELTVLGRYSPYPAPGGAMNGYLVQHGNTRLLLDCGNGVAARLLERLPLEQLTAVICSHLHEDHIADVHCLRFAQAGARRTGRTDGKLQIYAPAQPASNHSWIEGAEDNQDLHTYDPDRPLVLGGLEVRFFPTNHPIPCYAMRIKPVDAEGPVLFYTGDTGVHAPLVEAAKGASLLLVEASLTEAYSDKKSFGHLSAAEAAALARDAGCKRCIFTHIYPGLDPQDLLAEGRPVHAGIEIAEEGRTYRLS